ncbi:MAG: FG-GAP repeat domain-containing protein [Planctomycetaceae bacterium]
MSVRGLFLLVVVCICQPSVAQTSWRAEVLPVELSVGYAVQAIDISGDGKLDIAITDSKRYIWLENPSWKVHVMQATPDAAHDNVCFTPHDVDGDGHVDFAIGHDWQFGNSDSGGRIGWLHSPQDPRQPWTYHALGTEPTTHRMRWIDWNRDGNLELVVAPLKGKNSKLPTFLDQPVRLLAFAPLPGKATQPWAMSVIDQSLHVSHNLDVVDMNGDGQQELLVASFEGVTLLEPAGEEVRRTRLGSGQEGQAPAIGSSEIRLGKLAGKTRYLATIEPWHGDRVVVYTEPVDANQPLWNRHVIDEQLKWGHAVACANVDDDPEQELIIGVRDHVNDQQRCGVRIYDPIDAPQGQWQRQLVEPGQVAVEDLATGDFDGDGDTDIVAVGRATHNAVIYWNER